MLVLKRNEGEQIVITNGLEQIWITVVEGGRVRLGFEAPQHVRIMRVELLGLNEEEPQRASA